MTKPQTQASTPWLPNALIGTGFLFAGATPLALLWREASSRPMFVTICLTSSVIGLVILGKVWIRYRGTLVERRSVRQLKLPDGWKKESNLPLSRDGDLDLLVTGPMGERFAIEIKSYQGVVMKRAMFGKSEELRYRDGRPFSRDPVAQVLKASEEKNASPVIWLPEAPAARLIRMKCGVLVVQGGPSGLARAIGARKWF